MDHECLRWLDKKPPNSVLYVSFGSQNAPSARQTRRLAAALEASARSFVWVVRAPSGVDPTEDPARYLPEGFEDRIGRTETGFLVWRWAPQVAILSHGAVGWFLSHGGWNSTLEALSLGVPILGWPMAADQFYNVKMLAERVRAGVEVARGSDADVASDELASRIGDAMRDEGTRRRAGEVRRVIADAGGAKGSSTRALDEFLDGAFLGKEKMNTN